MKKVACGRLGQSHSRNHTTNHARALQTLMKNSLTLILFILSVSGICFAVDPDCPYCYGTGMHNEGGTSISHIDVVCRNCGEVYDAFYTHQCTCVHCINYRPTPHEGPWEEDIYYNAARQYANQYYTNNSYQYYETDKTSASQSRISSKASAAKYKLKPPKEIPQKVPSNNEGLPKWVWIVGCAIIIISKYTFFD